MLLLVIEAGSVVRLLSRVMVSVLAGTPFEFQLLAVFQSTPPPPPSHFLTPACNGFSAHPSQNAATVLAAVKVRALRPRRVGFFSFDKASIFTSSDAAFADLWLAPPHPMSFGMVLPVLDEKGAHMLIMMRKHLLK